MSGYNRIPWNLVVIFLILSAGISAVGYSTYDYQTEQIKISKQDELSAISDLKVNEITRWYQEIVDDGISLSKNEHFVSHVEQFSQNPDRDESRQDIIVWMKSIQENRQYKNALLFDSSGNMLISLPDEMADIEYYTKSLIEETLVTKKILFSDFYRVEENGNDTHIEMLIPLVSQDSHESSVGVLVIGIDHTVILDEIVLSQPIPSESSESLIVRREGDNVIFLNELRHQKDTALSLSMPISQAELPAAMAVTGTEGIVEGIDYRGVEVLSFVRAIPDTPWFMITKVDADEIYAPIHVRALYLSFIIGTLIVFSGIGIGLFWQHQNTQLLDIQKKSKYTRDLIETSLDILLSISPDGNIIEVNKATERITGISRNQLIGTDFSDYFTEPDVAKKAYQAVLDEGIVRDRELVVRHVSGDTNHVIFNGITYLDEAGNIQYIFAAGRDITELKRAENSLKKSHDKLEIRVKERT
ncbi:MAG: PAS domain S-box protein, partial [Methanosarcinales archaeon]|nr:PAS domain S-box protein [Methanosarcinales archaeon]